MIKNWKYNDSNSLNQMYFFFLLLKFVIFTQMIIFVFPLRISGYLAQPLYYFQSYLHLKLFRFLFFSLVFPVFNFQAFDKGQ